MWSPGEGEHGTVTYDGHRAAFRAELATKPRDPRCKIPTKVDPKDVSPRSSSDFPDTASKQDEQLLARWSPAQSTRRTRKNRTRVHGLWSPESP